MRRECNGVSYISLRGKALKFLLKSVDFKFCKLDAFLIGLEIPHRNQCQNLSYLDWDTPNRINLVFFLLPAQ